MKTLTNQKSHEGNNNYKKKQIKKQSGNLDQKNTKDVNVREPIIKRSKKVTEEQRKIFFSTIDPYDVPLAWWEAECVKYAINYPPVKSRLEEIMGSHVVRLTDHKYILQLLLKTKQNHEERQKIRIEERKLVPPSIISRLLLISYDALVERIQRQNRDKD